MLIGVLIFTCLGLLPIRILARSTLNRYSILPLLLRAFFAVCVCGWFFVVAGNHGVSLAILPSVLLLAHAIAEWEKIGTDVAVFVILVLQLTVLGAAFVYWTPPSLVVKAKQ